jgi:uncharacterized repeat protein (TIGR03803 family)
MSRWPSAFLLSGLLFAVAPTAPSHATAHNLVRAGHGRSHFASAKETVLYSFAGSPDGQFPQARLMRDAAGDLFGTTVRGGAHCNCGTVFKLTPHGAGFTESVIYSGDYTGKFPVARLFQDKSGNLFGSTKRGGSWGYGMLFKMVQSQSNGYTTTIIHQFSGKPRDGAMPEAPMITDGTNLFGTTFAGGGAVCHLGTVFELLPSGNGYTEHLIATFCGGRYYGSSPAGPLTMDNAGALYGTTQYGSTLETNCPKGCGTVFKLSPEGKGFVESTVYSFGGGSDGAYPVAGLVIDKSGAIYGTTQGGGNVCSGNTGCGTVFKLTPGSGGQYTETVIYRFAANYDGVQPTSDLVMDKSGVLYGTTTKSFGLNTCDCGTVFALTPSGSSYQETTLYAFQGGVHDGSSPYAGLVLDQPDRVLYGTTTAGGASNDGTVFEIDL